MKSDAVKVTVVSSVPAFAKELIVGASFTAVTLIVEVTVLEFNALSFTVKLTVRAEVEGFSEVWNIESNVMQPAIGRLLPCYRPRISLITPVWHCNYRDIAHGRGTFVKLNTSWPDTKLVVMATVAVRVSCCPNQKR